MAYNKTRYISNNICGYKPLTVFNLNALNQEFQFLYNQVCSIVTAGSENISNTSLTADGNYTQNWDGHQLLFDNISVLDFKDEGSVSRIQFDSSTTNLRSPNASEIIYGNDNITEVLAAGQQMLFGDGDITSLFSNAGTEVVTLSADSKVGIGNTSPTGLLTVGDGDTPYFNVFGGPLLQISENIPAEATVGIVKNADSTGRSGWIAEGDFQTDSPCYMAVMQYGSDWDPLSTPWANRSLIQSGGWNKGHTVFVNEGDWELVIAWDDGSVIDFNKVAMYASPWYRHGTFARTRPGGLIGINTKLPTAQLTITGETLGGDSGIDFKRLFDATATMPSTITAGEYDAIKWNITGGTTDKNHLHILDNATTVLKLNSNFIQIPKHTTGEINAISSPVEGMIVYNTTLHQICHYNGSEWRKVTDSTM